MNRDEKIVSCLKSVNIGVWEWDIVHNSLVWDENMYKLYGLEPKDFSGAYDAWEKTVHEEDKEKAATELKKAILEKRNFNATFRIKSPKFGVKYICSRAKIYIKDGVPISMIGINADISEEKKTERKINKLNKQLSAVFLAMGEGLILQTKSGKIFECNPAALKILGLSEEELKGRISMNPRWKSIKEDGSPFLGEDYPSMIALKTKKPQYNVPMGIYRKDGSLVWISITAIPLFQDNEDEPYQVIVSFSDITDKKKSEEFLRSKNIESIQEKKRFENFVYALNASAIVAITDTKGRMTFVNEKFCEISGYSRDELLGQNHRMINSGFHDKTFFKKIWSDIASGHIWQGEICNRKKNGSLYWVQSTIVPLYDESGKIHQYIAIRFETTERKMLEQHLIDSRESERKANHAKSDFLSNISHEIRTPLNGVIGMADILKVTNLDKEQKEYVNSIVFSGKILLELINDVLDYSKIEAGKMDVEIIETDFVQLIKEISSIHAFKARSKNLGFFLSLPEMKHTVLTDPGKISQILNNIFSNAMKFTEKGQINCIVSIDSESDDSIAMNIEIKDSGVGIPKEKIDQLFQAFTQADSSVSRKYGGTGLGLSIVKKLLILIGGDIWIDSQEGKGTRFFIKINLKKLNTEKTKENINVIDIQDKRKEEIITKNRKGHILIAEDNDINMTIITKMVSMTGCLIDIAKNGLEAVEKSKQKRYDLIFMDCRMPVMSGIEATIEIRKNEIYPNHKTPIIALTANASSQDREDCLKSGMSNFLTKPITKEKIFYVIEEYISEDHQKNQEIDFSIIEDLKNLNDQDDPRFFKDHVDIFMNQSKKLIKHMMFSIEKKDTKKVIEAAHSLNGSVANMGGVGISKKCAIIENQLQTQPITKEIEDLASDIQNELFDFF